MIVMLLVQDGREGHSADYKTSGVYLPKTQRQQVEDYGLPTTSWLHGDEVLSIEKAIYSEHLRENKYS